MAPGQSLADTLRQAASGDIIELQAGVHRGQVGVITQRALTLRGVGGPVVLQADGQHAEGKAILVVRDGVVQIENIEFRGARVPDGNGAGIRFERGRLWVRGCAFFDNQMGLLTANFADAELSVHNSRFGQAPGDQKSLAHLLYVGDIARFTLQGSHFSGGQRGHLVKSRARENRVLYNHLVDGPQGQASYELEFPNGGAVLVMGNVIQQGARTHNRTLLAFGAEGEAASGARAHRLVLAHNTWINDGPSSAQFVQVHRQRLRAFAPALYQNNLFVGPGSAEGAWQDSAQGNQTLPGTAAIGAGGAASDTQQAQQAQQSQKSPYALAPGSALRGQAVAASTVAGELLRPSAQFVAPAGVKPLPAGLSWSAGAVQD